ncbi:MAG: hypothetical protein ABS76_35640 [Pelagibacterium sp. SCN 64-44]|nr:MAG: hypothetical protein ABS76_35640 [Pelagibacterium sp. SCN 64-44]
MNRRSFLSSTLALGTSLVASPAFAQADFGAVVLETEAAIAARRNAGQPVTAGWVIDRLAPLDERLRRIAVFELVRRVPYKLSGWTGDPDSLFNLGRGDCRHKEAACRRLLGRLGLQVVHIRVLFDWADLPIPREILAPLTDTRGFHDTVEMTLDGNRVVVDPTWDPPLAAAGFPVLPAWDGVSATPPVTNGALTIVRPGDIPGDVNLYEHFSVRWPVRERTLEFNRAFNAWSDGYRM